MKKRTKKKAKAYVALAGRRKETSYYHLVTHEIGDGPEPSAPVTFLELVRGEVESEANLGPANRLVVKKPGQLIARSMVTFPKERKPYWLNLYRVRVYGPKCDIEIIRKNLKAEYGTMGIVDHKRLRSVGWTPVNEDGDLILPAKRGKTRVVKFEEHRVNNGVGQRKREIYRAENDKA